MSKIKVNKYISKNSFVFLSSDNECKDLYFDLLSVDMCHFNFSRQYLPFENCQISKYFQNHSITVSTEFHAQTGSVGTKNYNRYCGLTGNQPQLGQSLGVPVPYFVLFSALITHSELPRLLLVQVFITCLPLPESEGRLQESRTLLRRETSNKRLSLYHKASMQMRKINE